MLRCAKVVSEMQALLYYSSCFSNDKTKCPSCNGLKLFLSMMKID